MIKCKHAWKVKGKNYFKKLPSELYIYCLLCGDEKHLELAGLIPKRIPPLDEIAMLLEDEIELGKSTRECS